MQYQKLPTNVSKQTIFSQKRGLIHRNKSTLFWWRENSAGLNKHEGFQSHVRNGRNVFPLYPPWGWLVAECD